MFGQIRTYGNPICMWVCNNKPERCKVTHLDRTRARWRAGYSNSGIFLVPRNTRCTSKQNSRLGDMSVLVNSAFDNNIPNRSFLTLITWKSYRTYLTTLAPRLLYWITQEYRGKWRKARMGFLPIRPHFGQSQRFISTEWPSIRYAVWTLEWLFWDFKVKIQLLFYIIIFQE